MSLNNTSPLRILLVEANQQDRTAFRQAFQECQIPAKIVECQRAEEALERLDDDAESFDLIVVEHQLPGMSGLAFCQELLAQQFPAPVVLLTAAGEERFAVEGLKAGASDFLIKDPGRGYLELLPVVLPDIVRKHHHRTAYQQTEKALRRRNRELALLNRVGQELPAILDLQQVIEQLLQETTATIGADGASVWLWDEEQAGWLVCWAFFHYGHKRFPPVHLRLHPGQGIAGWTAQRGQIAMVPSAPGDPRFFPGIDEQTGLCTRSLLAVPLRARGAVIGVLEVVNKFNGNFDASDVALSETLAASAAIAIDNARLVEALRGHTAELQARNEELDAFAHTVAHDLKGPLSYILGFAGMLKLDHASMSEQNSSRSLDTIVRNAYKMNNIVDELLLLAGVRQMEVEMSSLDMASIVAEVLQRLAYMIEKYQAKIVVPECWPVALGHSPWVEEIWVNYLSNALKYGGRPPQVELGAKEPADGAIRFWVRDNGPGLTPEEQGRLFTPFTTLDQVRAQGHGLGLSIVLRIVEKLGGQVGIESNVGQGSVFAFSLPAA